MAGVKVSLTVLKFELGKKEKLLSDKPSNTLREDVYKQMLALRKTFFN